MVYVKGAKTDYLLWTSLLILVASLALLPARAQNTETSHTIMGVLDFEYDESQLRYIHPSFANYFHLGDRADFRGNIMEVDNWYAPLNATANVKVQGPDGSIVFEENSIATDEDNSFKTSLQITPEYKVGKYLAFVEPVKSGYEIVDNQYLAPFYVFRNNTHTVELSSQSYSVVVGAIQFESSNLKYDYETKKLSFDLKRLDETFAPDSDLGYPGHFLFVRIERPLLEGSLQYQFDDDAQVFWPSWQANDEFYVLQVGADEIGDHATLTIWGNQ